LKGRYRFGDLGVDGRIKMDLNEMSGKVSTGFIMLKIWSSGGLF
jgi:hypothetical protein